ncbi:helix-turn-helix domain-containing protein [Cellulomonas sp. zg-ZUI222]|nr:helix-turn-helix domain-containing protein [Cellulomonas wangleii]
MAHANTRLTPAGRFVMVQRIGAGRPVAHVAAEMGASRTTAWRWWRRFQVEGRAGLVDRPSVARSHPRRTSPSVEARVRIARMLSRRGPVRIGYHLGLTASTVGRIPDGGGHRALGRADGRRDRRRGVGCDYVHTAIDDHYRLAYAEIHDDEKCTACAGFLTRAAGFYASHGITASA